MKPHFRIRSLARGLGLVTIIAMLPGLLILLACSQDPAPAAVEAGVADMAESPEAGVRMIPVEELMLRRSWSTTFRHRWNWPSAWRLCS